MTTPKCTTRRAAHQRHGLTKYDSDRQNLPAPKRKAAVKKAGVMAKDVEAELKRR
jgi:hypothetical protein